MGFLRGWILPLVLTILLVAVFIPPDHLLAPEMSAALARQRWTQWSRVLLYLAVTIVVAWGSAHLGAWMLRRAQAGSSWERFVKSASGWLAVTGLSPLQPAVATMVIWALLPLSMAWGLDFVIPPTRLVLGATVVLFGIALGAEAALGTSGASRPPRAQLGSVISETCAALSGRVVIMTMSFAFISASAVRWDPPLHSALVSFDVREMLVLSAAMVLLASAVGYMGTRLGRRLEEASPEKTPRVSRRLAWILVMCALLLPLLGTMAWGHPLRADLSQRLVEAEGLLGSWGTDHLGRDLRARLFSAWWNATRHALLGAAAALALAFVLYIGSRQGCRVCTGVAAVTDRIPPPVLFFVGWGFASGVTGPGFTALALGVAAVLIPAAIRVLSLRLRPHVLLAVMALSGILLMLGWELTLGVVGFMPTPMPSFGTIAGAARGHLITAPWLITYSAGLFTAAAAIGITALHALGAAYELPRREILLRG